MRCPTLDELPTPPPGKTGWPWTVESPQLPGAMKDRYLWPGVSVVTPSFNQGQYIEETIRSVLLQGYPNLEYMIVDGGSTDGSVDIIRKYEPWLAHWVSEPDRGQSHAINKGWSRATGEVLAWLNSDDVYVQGAVGTAVNALSQHPEVAVVYSNCQYVDTEGGRIVLRRSAEFDLRRLLWNLSSYIPQPTAFICKSALAEVGFMNETLQYSMDYDLWLRIGMRYAFRYVDEVWAATRMHVQAKTVAFQREIWELKIKVFRAAMSSPYLPTELKKEAPALYSAYHFKMAQVCLRELAVVDALRYLKQSITLRPALIFEWQSWRRLLYTLLKLMRSGRQSHYWPTASDA